MPSSSEDLISSLPKEKGWIDKDLYLYEGFWYPSSVLASVMSVYNHFKAQPTDILLASIPRSGTLWLKAIIFATMNRTRYNISNHPLLTTNPHSCVPFLEFQIFAKPPLMDINNIPSPRLFGTHMPFNALPESIQQSGSKIIYICRNLKDTFISIWNFSMKTRDKELVPLQFDEAFELFCQGKSGFGPIWDHVKGYKQASLKWPDKVFFVTYEEMKRDSVAGIKRLAEFLGCPFSMEEENNGVVKDIIELCSFNNLSNLEVNKSGSIMKEGVTNDVFFRKGQVGDWENYLTNQMAEYLDMITKEKLDGIFT